MFGSLPGDIGGATRHFRRRICGQGKLAGIAFELARGFQYALDDSTDLAAEVLHKLIELGFAAFRRKLLGADALSLELLTLETVVLEDIHGPGDRADLVVAVSVPDFHVGAPLRKNGQRFRHGPERFGDSAYKDHRQAEHEQGGDSAAIAIAQSACDSMPSS